MTRSCIWNTTTESSPEASTETSRETRDGTYGACRRACSRDKGPTFDTPWENAAIRSGKAGADARCLFCFAVATVALLSPFARVGQHPPSSAREKCSLGGFLLHGTLARVPHAQEPKPSPGACGLTATPQSEPRAAAGCDLETVAGASTGTPPAARSPHPALPPAPPSAWISAAARFACSCSFVARTHNQAAYRRLAQQPRQRKLRHRLARLRRPACPARPPP